MRYPWFRLAIFVMGCLVPAWWLYEAAMNLLGPDPGKIMMDRLGLGALTFLLVTLSMTPLQKLTGWSGWVVVRRQLGLWCFAYIVLHILCYLFFILGLDWGQLAVELSKRPYIIVGALGFLGLTWLALSAYPKKSPYHIGTGLLLAGGGRGLFLASSPSQPSRR